MLVVSKEIKQEGDKLKHQGENKVRVVKVTYDSSLRKKEKEDKKRKIQYLINEMIILHIKKEQGDLKLILDKKCIEEKD